MSDKLIIALLLSFSTLAAVITSSPLKQGWSNANTDISLSINDKEIKVTAKYPKASSKNVHTYVRQALHLADSPDLRALSIDNYKTPDGLYSMQIRSKDGYLRIELDRYRNPPEAIDHAKLMVEGIKKALAEN